LKATSEGVFVTFAVLENAGRASLNVWIRRSLRCLTFDGSPPDFTIKGVNAKRVALAMLRRYPAKVLLGRRSARLMVVVKFGVNMRAYGVNNSIWNVLCCGLVCLFCGLLWLLLG